MLNEAKTALRITASAYDGEIASLIKAGARDLEIAGITLPGSVSFSTDTQTGAITDSSTLEDELCVRAILTYVRCHFGSPNDYDRVKASYDEQKAQLQTATGYTDFGEADSAEETEAGTEGAETETSGGTGTESGTGTETGGGESA